MNLLVKNLILIHKGSIWAKLQATFLLSVASSPFVFAIEKLTDWYTTNFAYLSFVAVAIILDHILGSWVHAFVKKDFSLKKNIYGLFAKAFLIVAVGILIEGFKHILGGENFIADYFNLLCRLMVFIYPAGSALMNCSLITKGRFPPTSFMERLTRFNKDMDINVFGKSKEAETEL